MNLNNMKHEDYVKPTIEVVEFSMKENIAASAQSFAAAICTMEDE